MTYNFKIAGAHMTRTQFFRVLVPAFTKAFTSENIRKGFENTGIYQINPKAKKVQETGPSAVTDKCKLTVVVGPLMFWALLFFSDICWHFKMEFCFSFRSEVASGSGGSFYDKRVMSFNHFLLAFADAQGTAAEGQAAEDESGCVQEVQAKQEQLDEQVEGAVRGDPLDITQNVVVDPNEEEDKKDDTEDEDEYEDEEDAEEEAYFNWFINKDSVVSNRVRGAKQVTKQVGICFNYNFLYRNFRR